MQLDLIEWVLHDTVNGELKHGLTSKDAQSPVKQRGGRLKARRRDTRKNGFFDVYDKHHLTRITRHTNIRKNERKRLMTG